MLVNFIENVCFIILGICVVWKFFYMKNMIDLLKKKYNNMYLEVKKKKIKKKFEEVVISCIFLIIIFFYFSFEFFEFFF